MPKKINYNYAKKQKIIKKTITLDIVVNIYTIV